MKLGKEHIQKIFLSLLALAFVIYVYDAYLLGPLNAQESGAKATIAKLQPQLRKAKEQINRSRAMESAYKTANDELAEINTMIPDGSPVTWQPTRIRDFFKQQGIRPVTTRLNGDAKDKIELSDNYKRLAWTIDLPKVRFAPLGIAISGLENEQSLLTITGIDISGSTGSDSSPEFQHASLTVKTIVKQ